MTFFLRDQPGPVSIPARNVDVEPTSFWGGVGAAFERDSLEANNNFRMGRETMRTNDDLAVEVARTLGPERVQSLVDEFNERHRAAGFPDREMPEDMADLQRVFGPHFTDQLLDIARNDPEWDGPDVSPGIAEGSTIERLKKEHKDLTQTLDAMGGGRGAAEILGGIGAAVADVRNVPFLFLGAGSGSFARVLGREAVLNATAEALTLPDRFEMSERLEIPKPDIATTLAMAAAGGALFGGAIEGLSRGITYWRGTRTGPSHDRVPDYDQQLNIDIAEDALAGSRRPFDQIRDRVVETERPRRTSETRVAIPDETPAPEPRSTIAETAQQDPASFLRDDADLFDMPGARGGVGERQMDLEDLITEARQRPSPDMSEAPLPPAVERRLTAEAGGNRPLINHLKNRYGGVSPTSRLGEELKALGITSRDAPGLFRKSGTQGFDNIPASEEPHLALRLGEDGNGYLDETSLADAIADEISGNPRSVSADQEMARIELNERRSAQVDMDRAAAARAGMEVEETLNRMPEAPGWVDSPRERQAIHGDQTADLRDRVAKDGDRTVDLGDGRRSVSSILDELDADDEFVSIIEMCGRRTA